jgi:hypothetical protein
VRPAGAAEPVGDRDDEDAVVLMDTKRVLAGRAAAHVRRTGDGGADDDGHGS